MHLEPALRADERRQQSDRAGAGDERHARLPRRGAGADAHDLLPGLGDDAGRLQQHAEVLERGIERDQEIRLDAELLAAIAVALFDAAFGVLAVAAHVPFAGGASRARHRIGPSHDADDEIAALEAAAGRRLLRRGRAIHGR